MDSELIALCCAAFYYGFVLPLCCVALRLCCVVFRCLILSCAVFYCFALPFSKDVLKHEMNYFEIPGAIQYRIQRHFDYLWLNQRAFGQIQLLQDSAMSEILKMEISTHLFKDVVASVPFFRELNRVLLGRITLVIKTQVFSHFRKNRRQSTDLNPANV